MSWIWLSHFLNNETPTYGNSGGIKINVNQSKKSGDSCNSHNLSFPNHVGSHVDVPYHFIDEGKKIDSYNPNDWIFENPYLIEYQINSNNNLIGKELLHSVEKKNNYDLLLIRTDFESCRGDTDYWENGPGLSSEIGVIIKDYFPNLKAIGIDFISISSFQNREIGRKAHVELLGRDIRLFEDLSLKNIDVSIEIKKVIALPLIFSGGDGSPVSIIALQ